MSNEGPKVGIVIVNYNGAAYQNDALHTIYESTYKNIDVVIVDSCSHDNSIQLAIDEFPQIHVLRQNENVGVAKGNNIGIRYCIDSLDSEYILLLNNDIELDKNTIKELVSRASKYTVCVPKIYYYEPHNMIWYAGGIMLWNRGDAIHIGNFEDDHGQYDVEKNTPYSPTCCMLIHKEVFEKIGLIEEDYFMYYDDTDLCVRILDSGFTILYVPSSFMWHKVSSSGGGMDSKTFVYYNTRNKFYFMKNYKSRIKFPARLYTFTKLSIKFLISPFYKKNDKYILKAWKDYKKGVTGRCDSL